MFKGSPRDLQKRPREAQGTPKGHPMEPKAFQEHPKGAQRPPKGIQEDVGRPPKRKKANHHQTSLFIMFELQNEHPGTPRRPPKVTKIRDESVLLHGGMPQRTKRAPKNHREAPRDTTDTILETLG